MCLQFKAFLVIAHLVWLLVFNVNVSVGWRHLMVFGNETNGIGLRVLIKTGWSKITSIYNVILFKAIQHLISTFIQLITLILLRRWHSNFISVLSGWKFEIFLCVFGRSKYNFSLQQLHYFLIGFYQFFLYTVVLLL